MFEKLTNAQLIKFTSLTAVFVAIVLVVLKFIAYTFTNSSAMMASLTDSIIDLTASFINTISIYVAIKPKDDNHSFGHSKAESLASLAQTVFIICSALFVIVGASNNIINKEQIQVDNIAIYVTCITIVITTLLICLQEAVIKKTKSLIIKADAIHYKTDILLNISVLISLLFAENFIYLDAVLAICIALYIISSAFIVAKTSIDSLMDAEIAAEIKESIKQDVLTFEFVQQCCNMRTRSSGLHSFVYIDIIINNNLSFLEVYSYYETIETYLGDKYTNMEFFIKMIPDSNSRANYD